MKNLLYFCVFHNRDYLKLASILLGSLRFFSNNLKNIDILVFTSLNFKEDFLNLSDIFGLNLNFKFFEFNTTSESAMARVYIYDYENINVYDKILYIDTDIIIQNDLNILFNQDIESEKVYALAEGTVYHEIRGGWFFTHLTCEQKHKIVGINSGILLWKNCEKIKEIFNNIINHIAIERIKPCQGKMPECADQPFINYHIIKDGNYNFKLLGKYARIYCEPPYPPSPTGPTDIVLCHFVWPIGDANHKKKRMDPHMSDILNRYTNIYKTRKDIISLQDYEKILQDNNHIFKKLEEICVNIGESVESNYFFKHETINEKIHELIYKQLNLYSLGKNAKNILEIGFNAGHSALLFLLSNPDSKLICFDIVSHKYTMPCFEYLNSLFPGRLKIIPGDSTITVPDFYKVFGFENKFDLIHIDGCHYGEIPKKDLDNCYNLLDNDGILIFNDTQLQNIDMLLNQKLDRMYEIKLYDTIMYKHRIFIKADPFYSKYSWGAGDNKIEFRENCNLITTWGKGYYKILDKNVVYASWNNYNHVLLFKEHKNSFVSFRLGDSCITRGEKK
jgi:predicted O-methyltransferase YrrM